MNALGAADPRPVHCQYSEAEPLFPLLEGPLAQFPAFPLWTDAYLGDTGHLTTLEHGAYFLLLITMWRNKGSLPDDDAMLCRYARLTKTQWQRIRPIIIEFFNVENGQITQGRLTDEYDAVRRHSKNQSKKAKARWLKEKQTTNAAASSRQCQADASPSLPLPHEDSVPNGTGAEAPKAIDPAKPCYDIGKPLLQRYDISLSKAGGLITRWLKSHPPEVLLPALQHAGSADRHDIVAFIEGYLRNGKTDQTQSDGSAERVARVVAGLERERAESLADPGGNADAVLPAVSGGNR